MQYRKLISIISNSTGMSPRSVRLVLDSLPDALMQDVVGSFTRTPVGTFAMKHYKSYQRMLPDGQTMSTVPEFISVRLISGFHRLKIYRKSPKWRFFFKGEKALRKKR